MIETVLSLHNCLPDHAGEAVGLWFFVAKECGVAVYEEGDFADAFDVRTREVGEEFVFGRWWAVVLWYFARWWGSRSWSLQMPRGLG